MMNSVVLWEKKLLQNAAVENQKFSVELTNEQAVWSVYTIDEYKGLCPQQDEMKLRRFLARW
jgi:hypothetical protein